MGQDSVPEAVSRAAVAWWVRLKGVGVGTSEHRAWQQWRAAHPDHERAWQQIEVCTQQWQSVNGPLARQVLSAPARAGRRRAVKVLSVLLTVGGAAAVVGGLGIPTGATHRTGVGERWTGTLPDGSVVALDTDTAIAVTMDGEQRHIRLLRGQLRLSTARTAAVAQPPLWVFTVHGRLRPLGTVFTVRVNDTDTVLGVLQDAVEAIPIHAAGERRIVPAGQQVRVWPTGVSAATPWPASGDAWASGMLVARAMPLSDFLAELSRYRRGRLVCAPQAATLPVSGIYPLHDTDAVLAMLADTLPVRVERRTPYWVTVRLR